MLDYMSSPKNKLTLGTTALECELVNAKVTGLECGFDQATITLDETDIYPSIVKANTIVKLEVTNEGDSYPATPLFNGICRFPLIDIDGENNKKTLTLNCLGSGWGLAEMVIAQEYGTQSSNPTIATFENILDDAKDNFLNKILGGASSNYTYTTDILTTDINSDLPYIEFPFKPVGNSLNDLVDAQTALNDGAAGPHWIVTTDNVIRLKQIGRSQPEWTKYYGGATNTAGNATLTYGEDYSKVNTEPIEAEGNYIIYSGIWRRPANGDGWTGPDCDTIWEGINFPSQLSVDTTNRIVGPSSLKCLVVAVGGSDAGCRIPTGATTQAHWNFNIFSDFNIPTMNFYIRKHGTITNCYVGVYNTDPDTGAVLAYGTSLLSADMADADKFYHFCLPLGQYYNTGERFQNFKWEGTGTLDWSDINKIIFYWNSAQDAYVNIDGFYFGDAKLIRVAWNSDLPSGYAKMRLITDNTGKDDSLTDTDDSGLMACFAKAELFRQQKTTQNMIMKTPMFPTALPGQFWSVQATEFRAGKIEHTITENDYNSFLYLTDDLTNGRTRARYEDQNKVWGLNRPEWQDRQASSIKAGLVDWRITRLTKDYAPP